MSSETPRDLSRSNGSPSTGRALIVELVGTPGAGKTTIARQLVDDLRARGCKAATVIEAARTHAARTPLGRRIDRLPRPLKDPLLWQLFYVRGTVEGFAFAWEHRRLAYRIIRTQLRRPVPAAMKRHTLYWYLQLAGRYRFLLASSDGREAILFDDGFLHRAVALHASHAERSDARAVSDYVDLLPKPDAVVHVLAPLEVCDRRVRERGIWRHSRRLSGRQLVRYMAEAEHVVQAAVARAKAHGWTIIEIENGDAGATVDLAGHRLARASSLDAPASTGRVQARLR
jgi:broad-specificity NMP kinase